MKTPTLTKALGVLALGFLLTGPLRANDGAYKDGMDEMSMDKAVSAADLTRDQKDKIKEARREQRDKMKELWNRKKDHLDTLKKQVDSKASDSEIEATLKDLKDDHEAIEAQRNTFHEQLEAMLTPGQRAKMLLNFMGKMKRPTEMK